MDEGEKMFQNKAVKLLECTVCYDLYNPKQDEKTIFLNVCMYQICCRVTVMEAIRSAAVRLREPTHMNGSLKTHNAATLHCDHTRSSATRSSLPFSGMPV